MRELVDDSVEVNGQVFRPAINLDASLELLTHFNTAEDRRGQPLYEAWSYAGYRLLPAFQQYLMWSFFVPLVKHHALWQRLRGQQIEVADRDYYSFGSLTRLLNTLRYEPRGRSDHVIFAAVSQLVLPWRQPQSPVLVCDDHHDGGWRYEVLKRTLAQLPMKFAVGREIDRKSLGLVRQPGYFLHGYGFRGAHRFAVPDIDFARQPVLQNHLTSAEFNALLRFLNLRFSEIVADCKYVLRVFERWRPRLILAYDQLERNLSIVLAARIAGIPVVSYQHGALNQYHAGWTAPGIPSNACNLKSDQLIVWGRYWKQQVASLSNKYTPDDISVGCHHNRDLVFAPEVSTPRRPATILVPYEFLPFAGEIVPYIEAFARRGWKTIIKLRPDFPESARLVYSSALAESVEFVTDLPMHRMLNEVTVIAGAQSTFLYEMAGLGKPIWYLRTSLRLIESIVQSGIAHEVNLELLSQSNALDWLFAPKCSRGTFEAMFAPNSRVEVLRFIMEQWSLRS